MQPPALLKDEAWEPMTKKITKIGSSPMPHLLIYRQGLDLCCATCSPDQVLTGDIVCPLILALLESTHISADSMALIID